MVDFVIFAVRAATAGILLLLIAGNGSAACTLGVGFGPGAPYNYPDKDGKNIGIDADILRIGLADIGCEVTFVALPWKRTLSLIEAGKLDATMSASFKQERALFAYYSIPYRGQPHVITLDKSSLVAATTLSEYLKSGHTLGVVLGWHYTNKIRSLIDSARFKNQIVVAPEFDNLLKMHDKNRFTGFLSNPSMLAGIIGREQLSSQYRMLRADIDILHYLFSRKSVSAEIAEKFNRNLGARFKAGYFMEVCKKYEQQLI